MASYVALSYDRHHNNTDSYSMDPDRDTSLGLSESPEGDGSSSFWSWLTFAWLSSLLSLGRIKTLQERDLWALNFRDTARYASMRFQAAWKAEERRFAAATHGHRQRQHREDEEVTNHDQGQLYHHTDQENEHPSLLSALLAAFGWRFMAMAPVKLCYDALQFVGPVCLHGILEYLDSDQQLPISHGLLFACAILLGNVVQTLCIAHYFQSLYRTGFYIRSGISTALYRKSFRLSSDSRNKSTAGEMVNLLAIDAARVGPKILPYLHLLWSSPLQIVLCLLMLYRFIGISALSGAAVMAFLIPFNVYLAKKESEYSTLLMSKKDFRVRTINEALNGIRQIKLYAWEDSFVAKIENLRKDELQTLKDLEIIQAIGKFVWSATPVIVGAVTFTFVAFDKSVNFTPSIAFSALALFNILRFPLNVLPDVIASVIEAKVSLKRLEEFLCCEEIYGRAYYRRFQNELPSNTIISVTGSYQWSEQPDSPKILNHLNIQVQNGQLVAIVGPVGAGKSSLLQAILGDMTPTDSSSIPVVTGSVSYFSQIPWIMNASLRENIVFGQDFDPVRYRQVIDACQLTADLKILPAGDATEIGEKGINLSGGQKARVALARCIYKESDVYLFDDPLSAVDTHVGRKLFEKVIAGKLLEGKVRILVTHHIQHLSTCDKIICLQQGCVTDIGSYSELRNRSKFFEEIAALYHDESDSENSATSSDNEKEVESKLGDKSEDTTDTQTVSVSKIVTEEERAEGDVDSRVYKLYFAAMGYGMLFAYFLTVLGQHFTKLLVNGYLSKWTNDLARVGESARSSTAHYVTVYVAVSILSVFLFLVGSIVGALSGVQAAKSVHHKMLLAIMRAPVSFFESTPVGRILNRFSKDQDSIDSSLPKAFQSTIYNGTFVGIAILTILYVTWQVVLVIIPLFFVYSYAAKYYLSSSREMKRLESISKSPLLAHFGETINGAAVIRSFNAEYFFIQGNEERLDRNNRASLLSVSLNRWLQIRLEFVGTVIVFGTMVAAVYAKGYVSAGLVGLSVSYALQITSTLSWLVRVYTDLETEMNSVERISHYSQTTPEAAYELPENDPLHQWPQDGKVEFRNAVMSYQEGMEPALRNVSFTIQPGSKVGIVGRTGAGKSSIAICLFRLRELQSGSILVDDVDIARLGLKTVRSRFVIISQDPILFNGTVRFNLDPFNEYPDAEIWEALGKSFMKPTITQMPGKLNAKVSDSGENFSAGQRQLLCLARALLRKAKVMILDEATAAVDLATDELIQRTIRTAFRECSLIVIAHRLRTIIDSDQIIVMDKGQVAECGPPSQLLQNERGIFTNLVDKMGTAGSSQLRGMISK